MLTTDNALEITAMEQTQPLRRDLHSHQPHKGAGTERSMKAGRRVEQGKMAKLSDRIWLVRHFLYIAEAGWELRPKAHRGGHGSNPVAKIVLPQPRERF
ncbi:hypothetical protein AAFF_G00047610 [Aldrovandia affinis]|uniref:Uncharacterized protein n=1 Tax=Aldrovandia affinis TaxID=143900 RepID=A0AAD7S1P3_9TELE|nr:hypothetical protein AAFF_G00047610 [Aldrovandia affinis]